MFVAYVAIALIVVIMAARAIGVGLLPIRWAREEGREHEARVRRSFLVANWGGFALAALGGLLHAPVVTFAGMAIVAYGIVRLTAARRRCGHGKDAAGPPDAK